MEGLYAYTYLVINVWNQIITIKRQDTQLTLNGKLQTILLINKLILFVACSVVPQLSVYPFQNSNFDPLSRPYDFIIS